MLSLSVFLSLLGRFLLPAPRHRGSPILRAL
jgi:hypothetical protein